ncbi:L,D-transpeptidase family protein [Paraclostridium benzoelyticum]|uniref:L,D-transpeptidase family protein n=1 Tax=Paraclostridium benzoelyticum TaxID=1629550 RepID=UPI000AF2BB45|nr:L,D-transpeptidase [Paraclostridium benzoelyticum]
MFKWKCTVGKPSTPTITGIFYIDGRLGQALSHGCIRLDTENAKCIYNNILDTTTVVVH